MKINKVYLWRVKFMGTYESKRFFWKELLFASYFSSDIDNCSPSSLGTTLSMISSKRKGQELFQFNESLIRTPLYIEKNGKNTVNSIIPYLATSQCHK